MRVLALALLALAVPAAVGARPSACPAHAPGTIRFVRAGHEHAVRLTTCADRVAGRARPAAHVAIATPDGRVTATVRASGHGRSAKQTIWITDRSSGRSRPVFSETQHYTQIGPGDTPGPIVPLKLSPDGRWVFFTIDPGGSGSIAADGLILRVVATRGGAVHKLGVMLPYPDYLTWCGGRVVFAAGGDRVAIHGKRLLSAAPPSWRPRPLWNDRSRSFASPACEPGRAAVTVLTQHSSVDAGFFHTRWQLWRVGLDGKHALLDAPPAGWADEAPQWSRDGRWLLFVRERNGYGRVMLLHDRAVVGPVASLGYSLGYYGHHDWALRWSAA